MRAVCTAPFHQPVTGELIPKATVLLDADLTWLPAFPDLAHNLAFTDRTPSTPGGGVDLTTPVNLGVPAAHAEKE